MRDEPEAVVSFLLTQVEMESALAIDYDSISEATRKVSSDLQDDIFTWGTWLVCILYAYPILLYFHHPYILFSVPSHSRTIHTLEHSQYDPYHTHTPILVPLAISIPPLSIST